MWRFLVAPRPFNVQQLDGVTCVRRPTDKRTTWYWYGACDDVDLDSPNAEAYNANDIVFTFKVPSYIHTCLNDCDDISFIV